jgi:hypothetical protein
MERYQYQTSVVCRCCYCEHNDIAEKLPVSLVLSCIALNNLYVVVVYRLNSLRIGPTGRGQRDESLDDKLPRSVALFNPIMDWDIPSATTKAMNAVVL